MSDFATWYNRIPQFTKWWLTLTVLFSLGGRLGLLKGYSMLLLYEPLILNFEVWRPLTALFYYPISPQTGFHFLINCYFLYNYSNRLESVEYIGKPADYFYMLIVNWFCCVLLALIIEMPLLMDAMVLSVLYIWCQLNKDVIVTFWFGTRFKAMYLPWVLFGFNFIIASGGVSELIGIVVGHIYYFLKFTYPQESGGQLWLKTPSFLYEWFPNQATTGFGTVPQARSTTSSTGGRGGGHSWGQGRVLGGRDHAD